MPVFTRISQPCGILTGSIMVFLIHFFRDGEACFQLAGVKFACFSQPGQHIIQRTVVSVEQLRSRNVTVAALNQQVAGDAAVLYDPAVFSTVLLFDILLQASALVAAVQAVPKDGVAALVGLERLVVAGDEVSTALPGILLLVFGANRRSGGYQGARTHAETAVPLIACIP